MELNRNTIIISIIVLLITIPFLIGFEVSTKTFTIVVGVATALLVTILMATINYLHERKFIVNKVYESFSEIYFALMQIDKEIGKALISKTLTDNTFGINYKLTMHIIDIANSSQVAFYKGFSPFKLSNTMKKFDVFISKLRNLNQLTGERAKLVLSNDLFLTEIKTQTTLGADEKILQDMSKQAQESKENLLILVSKLHEYEVSLKLELNDLISELDKNYKFAYKWNDKKQYFESITIEKGGNNGIF